MSHTISSVVTVPQNLYPCSVIILLHMIEFRFSRCHIAWGGWRGVECEPAKTNYLEGTKVAPNRCRPETETGHQGDTRTPIG